MAEPLVPDAAARHTGCLLMKLGQVMFRLSEDRLTGLGLRTRHYLILQALAEAGARSQLELGNQLRIDPTTMVSSIDHLERLGLATRTRDPQDRRRFLIAITDEGRSAATESDRLLASLNEETLADLDSAMRDDLHRLLLALNAGDTLPRAYDATRDVQR
ncbi:MarR family winged helix-turn-helix transcriptional regulator [Rhodococcus daqingensis]|uniref:MarR family winged helix-turn-helix transcriptional regulator n=1 Tax=Rhodococcus daqingensis TaxID=2479363 RepID=A0ABW2S5M8_9NOCA